MLNNYSATVSVAAASVAAGASAASVAVESTVASVASVAAASVQHSVAVVSSVAVSFDALEPQDANATVANTANAKTNFFIYLKN